MIFFFIYDQLLVAAGHKIPCYFAGRSPGSRSSREAAFPISQWHHGSPLPVYSDKFAQDFHLFPFSSRGGRPPWDTCRFVITNYDSNYSISSPKNQQHLPGDCHAGCKRRSGGALSCNPPLHCPPKADNCSLCQPPAGRQAYTSQILPPPGVPACTGRRPPQGFLP